MIAFPNIYQTNTISCEYQVLNSFNDDFTNHNLDELKKKNGIN